MPKSEPELAARPQRTPLVPPGTLAHHVRDMIATFSADVTLAEAQAKLAEANQWLPIDGDSTATLGHLVATNSTGPLRLGYGAWRDLLLGVQFLNGDGELITAGGQTVKNVAGYDLTKFMVGQRGIFGQLVTLTTRTYQAPAAALLARFPVDVSINQLLPTTVRPHWALLTASDLLCGYLGDEASIGFYERNVQAHGAREVRRLSPSEDVQHRAELWGNGAGGDIRFRASVPPASVPDFVHRAALSDWIADPAFGIVIGPAEETRRAAIHSAATAVGGSVFFHRADGSLLSGADGVPHSAHAVADRMIHQLKRAFDPQGRLTPLE